MDMPVGEAVLSVLEIVLYILHKFTSYLFDVFIILPTVDTLGFNITYGYFIIAFVVFSLIFKFLLAVPQTGGGGKRGKRGKGSKKGSSSSSSDSSDS